ncbi:hypothetical protein SAMD00019534_088310 [Acytostelium subglobosum LB1]|uniref:hypothetical protein n=1 Tax=Acytostelium subglobosum LB1 TaxID=1410327 RepID=UPI000644E99F|nr:hypothetical protein SAMD00019534_088310 [Acytostelium subglobosum LB1]GAM25656.1 hypothetical protein SAMD00019534_088310 [Acytostelium subglobosum LB1]|eukprot:XP_012751642.1 hypothetical protein SAMD00019534_088310 [Acytostelium subglobosum LB1]
MSTAASSPSTPTKSSSKTATTTQTSSNYKHQIQVLYNEFQDCVSKLDHYYSECESVLNRLMNSVNMMIGGGSADDDSELDVNNNTSSSSSSSSSTSTLLGRPQSLDNKDNVEYIHSHVNEQIQQLIDQLNEHVVRAKQLIRDNASSISDLNSLASRGKTQCEVSILDLVEFMATTYFSYEQDFQMKQALSDDLSNIDNQTMAVLSNTVLLWQHSPLINKSKLAAIVDRLELFNSLE